MHQLGTANQGTRAQELKWPCPEIGLVLVPLRAVTLAAQSLQVCQLRLPAARPGNNVIDILSAVPWLRCRTTDTARQPPSAPENALPACSMGSGTTGIGFVDTALARLWGLLTEISMRTSTRIEIVSAPCVRCRKQSDELNGNSALRPSGSKGFLLPPCKFWTTSVWRNIYDFDKDFLIELEPCSTHYEMYDR
jgi:hypothetical protein